jgi:hypothetical protein
VAAWLRPPGPPVRLWSRNPTTQTRAFRRHRRLRRQPDRGHRGGCARRRLFFGGVPDYYAEIATALDLPYEGEVLRKPALKSDRIHANSAGYRRIGERLAVLLKDAGAV